MTRWLSRLGAGGSRTEVGRQERGAAAVEMALILPVLLFVLMGLIDFGRAYNTQIMLTQAAREGARAAALSMTSGQIQGRVAQALPSGMTVTYPSINPCPSSGGTTGSVTVQTSFTWITGISAMSNFFGPGTFPNPGTMSATGVMQCTS